METWSIVYVENFEQFYIFQRLMKCEDEIGEVDGSQVIEDFVCFGEEFLISVFKFGEQ